MHEPPPLTTEDLVEYERLLGEDLSGEEQTAMRERDPEAYTAWLDAQITNVPMPSRQKPAINEFREGDRVRLTQLFRGETVSYSAGRMGTFLITDTAPAQIRLARTLPLYELLMDGPPPRLIGVSDPIERIPGQFRVTYDNGSVSCSPLELTNGERVQLDRDCRLGGVPYPAGTIGTVHQVNNPVQRAELVAEDRHAIVLDVGGVVLAPGAIVRPLA